MSKKEKAVTLHIRRSTGDWVFDIALIVFVCVFTVICIFPFYYLLINTISDNDLVTSGRVNFYPLVRNAEGQAVFGAHFISYTALQNVQDLGGSVIVTVSRTIFCIST